MHKDVSIYKKRLVAWIVFIIAWNVLFAWWMPAERSIPLQLVGLAVYMLIFGASFFAGLSNLKALMKAHLLRNQPSQLETAVVPLSQEEPGNNLPLDEAIEVLLQQQKEAVMQVEAISTQLAQLLEQKYLYVEALTKAEKKKRKISPFLAALFRRQRVYWQSLALETEEYQRVTENYCTWLETQREEYHTMLDEFEHLQEEMNLL